ncbi:MAG: hypothetical protein NNA31_13025 [Nitrospira sp.]|nr:hypothetical protein [Nitrospira sp.]
MLHRMALRVLPSLSLAVTEESVRKRKRLIMLVPGLVAFAVYRVAKHLMSIAEPLTLLLLSSLIAMATALFAYRIGRSASWGVIARQDGGRVLAWMAFWIGAVYGAQLSLLVLALLWMVGYDYLQHPDGPAMMAIMVACTSVARDAFEIGHVRRMAAMGRPFPTFPDGAPLRDMIRSRAAQVGPWVAAGSVIGAAAASLDHVVMGQQAFIVQLLAVTLLGGAITLCAYFGGMNGRASWTARFSATSVSELFKYWWWPGLAFSSTYYLVAAGVGLFVVQWPTMAPGFSVAGGGFVGGMMALYGYYLGHRRHVEEQQGQRIDEALLRCPFVMGILGRAKHVSTPMPTVPGSKV